ncbi:long-chain fatty acid--CoA ligase [Pleurocapsa sp. PCC 7319]|uniref:AMP-dependent synthetase/ligase n=1 Tax=Pleurocapsa sp. PCC 7319 TaxID=118161 RepID=UPI00034A7A45|nr:AMP-binding protein [Pleurocapsa sp. PCC 7319]
MFYANKINRSFSPIDRPILGRTLPSLLDEAVNHYPNHHAFNQWQTNTWQSLSNQELLTAAEHLALGLLEEKLERSDYASAYPKDRIALLMHDDVNFCLADFGSLLAGLIDVPIDLSQTLDNIGFILRHSEAKVLIVSDIDLLAQVIPYFESTPKLQTVIVANIPEDWEVKRTQLLTCGLDKEFGIRNSPYGFDSLLKSGNPPNATVSEFGVQTFEDREFTANKLSNKNSQDLESSHLDVQLRTTNSELLTTNSSPACLCIPMLLCQSKPELSCPELPQCIQLFSLDEVRARGKKLWSEKRRQKLRSLISPQDLATIVYIAGETGQPKGVMLSHENISADILTTFKSIPDLKPGATETILSFLPLTHIFARAFVYGHLNYGHSIYFSTPNRAVRDFTKVQPTIVATVPRLLEKIYQKILDRGHKLQGIKKIIFTWALKLAQSYDLGQTTGLLNSLQFKLADRLVFSQWRKPFGGRLKYFISGGAALKGDIANILSAAKMTVLQGYGLTETSSVICCNRDGFNRAGTVGLPIPGVKIAIADDGEILVKAPYVMQGYYENPEATQSVMDDQGWLHTGDLGEFTTEGYLTITGSKKELFKLSTGKYVTPQPLEEQVKKSSLVEQAMVVGMQKKFCGMLIFPRLDSLREQARVLNLYVPINKLLQQPEIIALYQTLVDNANQQLPSWSKVKRFQLLNAHLTIANGLLLPNMTVNRAKVNEVFAREIDALYGEETILSSELVLVASQEASQLSSKLVLRLKKFILPSWQVFIGYFRSPQHKSIDFIEKMHDRERQGRAAKFRTTNLELRTLLVKPKLFWKRIKNYITLPSTMPWKFEKNSNSEDLDKI